MKKKTLKKSENVYSRITFNGSRRGQCATFPDSVVLCLLAGFATIYWDWMHPRTQIDCRQATVMADLQFKSQSETCRWRGRVSLRRDASCTNELKHALLLEPQRILWVSMALFASAGIWEHNHTGGVTFSYRLWGPVWITIDW